MFNSIGLFSSVPCPQDTDCGLLNCIFDHSQPGISVSTVTLANEAVSKSTKPVATESEPSRKKRRVEDSDTAVETREETKSRSPIRIVTRNKQLADDAINGTKKVKNALTNDKEQIVSTTRDVSPPALRSKTDSRTKNGSARSISPPWKHASSSRKPMELGSSISTRVVKKEALNPRLLSQAPAKHAIRLALLDKLHKAMVKLNEQVSEEKDESKRALVLSADELVILALDEEEMIAKESPSIYSNILKQRIQSLTKMPVEKWKASVLEDFAKKYIPDQPMKIKQPKVISTGLSVKEEIVLLDKLVTPLNGLEKHGYVTSAPSEREIETARQGLEAAGGWEKCDRCGSRFQVFPGRREEDGALTSNGKCTYHWARPFRPPKEKGGNAKESFYPCCNEAIGVSAGCTRAGNHVFKVSDPKRLASILQFESTPQRPDEKPKPPVTFDCEMGYTTKGLELIRLTAVSWPEGNQILDILVRPMGEILDLNSRFSGVWPEQLAKAVPYGHKVEEANQSDSEDGEVEEPSLQIVESPIAARTLLFELIQPDTVLIGHAIDNDLNVCRIIHPTIIDTVLLFPHPKGLPIRFGLKMLSNRYLDRSIQTGGALGHDSKEDARATGDLVKVKLGLKWAELRNKGWKLKDEEFRPPEPLPPPTPKGPKGAKRKNAQVDGADSSGDDSKAQEEGRK